MQKILDQIKLPRTSLKTRREGNFLIIGNGRLGGKMENLMNKQGVLEECGFRVPETIVLATDFFEGLYLELLKGIMETEQTERFQANLIGCKLTGITRTELEEEISLSKYSPYSLPDAEKIKMILAVTKLEYLLGYEDNLVLDTLLQVTYGGRPFCFRSSQLNETGGSGKYYSGFASDLKGAKEEIKKVFASSDNPADLDMAAGIQPLIGKHFADVTRGLLDWWFPLVAGCAFTTRIKNTGEGKIFIVNGLGVKAVKIGGEVYFFGENELRKTEDDLTPFNIIAYDTEENHVTTLTINPNDPFYIGPRDKMLRVLPALLKKLEGKLGPQYVEYALGEDGIYCVQIADYEPMAVEKFDFEKKENRLAISAIVGGYCKKKFSEIIWVSNARADISDYISLDETYKDYLLVMPAADFSSVNRMRITKKIIPNAGGVIAISGEAYNELEAGSHARSSLGNIPFMILKDQSFLMNFKATTILNWFKHAKVNLLFEVDETFGTGQLLLLLDDNEKR